MEQEQAKESFNLSRWALEHSAFTRYLMIILMLLGLAAYFQLGQDEDPPFTFRAMVVRTYWPGSTAQQVAEQVTDKLERALQEVPYADKIRSYSKPGESQIIFQVKDSSKGSEVANLWYSVRKKIGDMRGTVLRDADNRRPRGHHLTRLGVDRSHNAGDVRHQRGITDLIALPRPLGLRLFELRLGGFQGGFAALQLGPADEILVFQFFIALEISRRQVAVGGRRSQLGSTGGRCQLVVLRVQLGQHLPSLDALAQFNRPLGQLAADPKTQPGFDPGPDFAGKLDLRLHTLHAHRHDLDRAHRLLHRSRLGTGSQ